MIQSISHKLDDAIEHFEFHWLPDDLTLQDTLRKFGIEEDIAAITELARIDIERRYSCGLSPQPSDYLKMFPELIGHPAHAAEIAFEDYRVRRSLGMSINPELYRPAPGVLNQAWFQDLLRDLESKARACESAASSKRTFFIAAPNQNLRERSLQQVPDEIIHAAATSGFNLVQPLGNGSFGQVFLATQQGLADRYVAIKIVRNAFREPQILALLQHTNIVPIYSVHHGETFTTICMPYAGGMTLDDFLGSHSAYSERTGESLVQTVVGAADETLRSVSEAGLKPVAMIIANENVTSPLESVRCLDRQQLAIWMFSRLASGLAHAHARGVIHGDIKPANVLIRNDGEPALMDFNLSRFIKDNHEVGAGGTMAYMSPEALGALMRNEDHRDLRSDVYSLGVMFHEVLTGRLPYPRPRSGADIDIEVAITSRNSPVAWTASDSVSLSLQRIVEKCLACDVADRYQSADDFNEDLLLQASSQPLKHAQDSIATRMTKWWHRHRSTTLLILLGVIAIAGLAGVVAISMIWREHTRQTTALASFTQFRQSADRALIKTILSQNRFEDSVLNHLVRSLTDYALIDKQTIQEIVLDPSLSAGDRDFRRAVVFRQLIAAAMTESRRLQLEDHAFKTQRTKTRPSLDRFDTLLNAAQLVIAGNHSNSLRQLKRDRASLAGEKVDGESYSRSAGRLVNSETEVFLAALRACFEKDWERVIVFLDSLPSESVIPSPLQLAIHARAEHANKNFAEAKQKLSQLLHAGYSLPEVYVLRGQCAYRTQQFESAQADWRMASKEDSNQLRSRYELCLSLIRANQFKEAIAEASRGLAVDSTNIPLLLLRSKAHREIGNTEAAQRDFDQANSIESTSVTALDLRARVKADTDLNGAIKDLLLALDMSNQSPVILQRLSLMYCKAGNLSEAIEALQKACVCLPNDEMLHIDLAVLLARNHQFEDSRNHLKIAIELPNAPRVIYQAACVNALLPTQEEHQRGISYLSAAIQRSYGAKSFESDPDLESLRALPGYQAIMRMTRLAKIPDAEDSLNSDDDLLTL